MNNVIIIAYDISNDQTRLKFSKFLGKYGVRVQFSVFEISHSTRVLNIVKAKIDRDFRKLFESGDSIFIFKTDLSNTIRYGSSSLLDNDLIFL
jgi:CRISPR-associated protein Cas2